MRCLLRLFLVWFIYFSKTKWSVVLSPTILLWLERQREREKEWEYNVLFKSMSFYIRCLRREQTFIALCINGNPLQYSCLEKPMDRGAWWATIHGVAKSQTRLHMHALITPILKMNYSIMERSWKSWHVQKHAKESGDQTQGHCLFVQCFCQWAHSLCFLTKNAWLMEEGGKKQAGSSIPLPETSLQVPVRGSPRGPVQPLFIYSVTM